MKKSDITYIALVGTTKRTSNSYGKNLPYRSYRVLLQTKKHISIPIEYAFAKEDLKDLSYWSPRSNTMAMTCWGTSQLFEAQIALGRFFGFDEKNWPAFSDKVTHFIQEI